MSKRDLERKHVYRFIDRRGNAENMLRVLYAFMENAFKISKDGRYVPAENINTAMRMYVAFSNQREALIRLEDTTYNEAKVRAELNDARLKF